MMRSNPRTLVRKWMIIVGNRIGSMKEVGAGAGADLIRSTREATMGLIMAVQETLFKAAEADIPDNWRNSEIWGSATKIKT